MNMVDELKWRGLLKNIANEEYLKDIIVKGNAFYVGVDPTGPSLHIGHYMIISLSRILFEQGMKPIFVIGGFTGMIGDPSGKNSERDIIDQQTIKDNVESLKTQISELAIKIGVTDFEVFDNNTIYNELTIVDLFQKYGKNFNINNMLNKEMVKNRLETGISFTEFSYQMFQAIDFFYLNENKNVKLQISGSDQWGNIVSGIELIRKIRGSDEKVAGITVNLLTDMQGNKIGKTAGSPVWLNKELFSSYSFFQYLINLDDETAQKMLSSLTIISEDEYIATINDHKIKPQTKSIQHKLAKLLMKQIYDGTTYELTAKTSKIVFEEKYSEIIEGAKEIFSDIPTLKCEALLVDTLINAEVISSKREYKEFLESGAIKVNGTSIRTEEKEILDSDYINNEFIIINVGKKKKFIIWK